MDKFFEDGSQITLDIRKAGDFLGESMFSEQGTYPVSATCIEDTLTCGFTRTAFEEKILAYPNIGLQIIKTLSNRINHLTGRIGSMAATSIEKGVEINGKKIQKITCISISYIEKASVLVYSC
jgi:CRP/FNR family transcriptional regulator